jgi:fructose-bisphosphate aldolase, class II
MPLAGIKEILTAARRGRYGVLSLLGGNLEMAIGQIAAAEELRAPLILAFNQEVTPRVPMALGMPMLVNAASRARVPVATILDHGHSLEAVLQAIRLGSSSVMFDGSTLPYEENVRQTAEVVRAAHALGISVEGELGSIAGSAIETGRHPDAVAGPDDGSVESTFTDPRLAVDFVRRTGVDALAISFGNVHGTYQGEPHLDLDLVRQIHSLVDVPLVMHGASGLADEEYGRIVGSGISKVCYYTAMGKRASDDLCQMLAGRDEGELVYHEIISRTIEFFQADTKRVMALVGCAGVVSVENDKSRGTIEGASDGDL